MILGSYTCFLENRYLHSENCFTDSFQTGMILQPRRLLQSRILNCSLKQTHLPSIFGQSSIRDLYSRLVMMPRLPIPHPIFYWQGTIHSKTRSAMYRVVITNCDELCVSVLYEILKKSNQVLSDSVYSLQNRALLMYAIVQSHIEIIKILLGNKFKKNVQMKNQIKKNDYQIKIAA